MPKPAAISPAVSKHDRRPDHVQRRDDQRDDAEHRILEQRRRQERGSCTAWSAGRHRRPAPRVENSIAEIAQIERVADGDEADDQQPLHLIGRQPERGLFHRGNMARESAERDKPERRCDMSVWRKQVRDSSVTCCRNDAYWLLLLPNSDDIVVDSARWSPASSAPQRGTACRRALRALRGAACRRLAARRPSAKGAGRRRSRSRRRAGFRSARRRFSRPPRHRSAVRRPAAAACRAR